MLNKIILISLVLSCLGCDSDIENTESINESALNDKKGSCYPHLEMGRPGKSSVGLCRIGYYSEYSFFDKTPLYTSQYVTAVDALFYADRSVNYYQIDEQVSEEYQSTNEDYLGSGFDKGHLSSWASMGDPEAAEQSNLLTNIMPMTPSLNRGALRLVEKYMRDLIISNGDGFIFTGPVGYRTYIGNGVSVSDGIFKIVFIPNTQLAYGFILPNVVEVAGDFRLFQVSIDEIENKTKLDFLSELQDEVEGQIEANIINLNM